MIRLLKYILGNILYLLSYIVPKAENVWIFGATGGKTYSDSPKYIFEYIVKNNSELKPVWLTRSKRIKNYLQKKGHKVYMINSIAGLYYSLRANVGIISHGLVDINRYCTARINILDCWHGIPIKPVLLSDVKKEAINKRRMIRRLKYIFPSLYREFNYPKNLAVLGSGDLANMILAKIYGSKTRIIDLGFPRLDGIFSPAKNQVSEMIRSLAEDNNKVGLYIPTYRREMELNIIDHFKESEERISRELQQKNIYLFVKLHAFEKNAFIDTNSHKRIIHIDNTAINDDIYSILGLFDFLITDYSSIIFDFLIIPKPVILLTPDRASYIESNGDFVFDYKDLGIDFYQNWEELLEGLDFENHSGKDLFKKLSERIHKYQDGNSSKRVYDFIINKTMTRRV